MGKLQDGRHFACSISWRCPKPANELELLHLIIDAFALPTNPSCMLFIARHQARHQGSPSGEEPPAAGASGHRGSEKEASCTASEWEQHVGYMSGGTPNPVLGV